MDELRATLVALRMVIFFLGFFLGMAYSALANDQAFGLYFSLFIAAIIAWAWVLTERDVKEHLK